MSRPAVDVVVPFAGSADELRRIEERLAALSLRPDDSVVVIDNTNDEIRTPAYARNRGTERGNAPWLVFIDADVTPAPDLLDRYFDPPPAQRTALLAGGVRDEAVPPDAPGAARYAYLRALMSQDDTFAFGWGFPTMTNAACRREPFEAVGGFRNDIRAGEDADLTFRLRAAGWEVERREPAFVVHHSRQTVRGLIAQKATHGAGGAWIERTYPGAFPARRRPGLVWWGVRTLTKGLLSAARKRDRDTAVWAVFEPLELLSFEFGRSLPNERPPPRRWRRLLT